MMRKRSEEREQAFCLLFQSLFNTDENFEIYEENIESVGDYARSIALGVEEKRIIWTDLLKNIQRVGR